MKKKTFVKYLFAVGLLTAGCTGTGSENTIPAEIVYDTAVVSYLGPEGTYTQEACGQFFEKKGSYLPFETVQGAVEALIRKETGYAVIPQENTIGGAVIDYLDTLLAEDQISIVGEVELPADLSDRFQHHAGAVFGIVAVADGDVPEQTVVFHAFSPKTEHDPPFGGGSAAC